MRLHRPFLFVAGSVLCHGGAVILRLRVCAALAECAAMEDDLTPIIDALAALLAGNPWAFESGKLVWRQRDFDPRDGEELIVREFAVSGHLLLVLIGDGRKAIPCKLLGAFAGGEANAGIQIIPERSLKVDKGRGHLAEIKKLKSALAEAAAGNHADRIGCATVDFYKGHEALALSPARVCDAQQRTCVHGHADAEDLARAEVAVCDGGVCKQRLQL